MKRFLCRCAALFLVVAALLWVGGLAYKHTTTYKNLDRTEETEKYHAMPDGITFAVFGASHGRDAFQAADYPDETFFNFSMSSQTPLYDLMQLRQFRGHLTPGATVVVTVSYMSPFWTESEDSFSDKQERYYRILSPQNIVDCDVGHWVLVRWSPLLTNDCTDVLSAFIHPPELRADTNTLYGPAGPLASGHCRRAAAHPKRPPDRRGTGHARRQPSDAGCTPGNSGSLPGKRLERGVCDPSLPGCLYPVLFHRNFRVLSRPYDEPERTDGCPLAGLFPGR